MTATYELGWSFPREERPVPMCYSCQHAELTDSPNGTCHRCEARLDAVAFPAVHTHPGGSELSKVCGECADAIRSGVAGADEFTPESMAEPF